MLPLNSDWLLRTKHLQHGLDEQTYMGFVQLHALSELQGDLTLTWEGKDNVEACGSDEGRKPAFPAIQQHQHQPCVHTRPFMRRRMSICIFSQSGCTDEPGLSVSWSRNITTRRSSCLEAHCCWSSVVCRSCQGATKQQ